MAYASQETKKKIQEKLKPVLDKYKVKGSLRIRNHSTVVLTLRSGEIDFVENMNRVCSNADYKSSHAFRPVTNGYIQVNHYWYQDNFDGKAKEFLSEAINALKSANWYDRSDAMVDYFETAYYFNIHVGDWNKPYIVQ